MKNFFFMLILVFGVSSLLQAKGNKSCFFQGLVDGKKIKSFRCDVERAGATPYLLVGIKYQKSYWMIDLNGIKGNPGNSLFSLSAMKLKGKKLVASYSSSSNFNIKLKREKEDILYIKSSFLAKSRMGQQIKIQGVFAWKKSIFPTKRGMGTLKLRFGSKKLKPVSTKVKPWSSGFQINYMYIVKGGETLNFNLEFPSIKKSAYKKMGKCRIMHFKSNKTGKLSSAIYMGKDLKVRVQKFKGKLKISFKGWVRSKNGKKMLMGLFYE